MSYQNESQFFRIDVPEPGSTTELVLGTGPNGFHGILGRVENGGVFIGAGGYPMGVPSQAASYEGLKRVHTGLSISIGGVTSLLLLLRAASNKWDACAFSVAINAVSLGVGVYSSTLAGIAGGTPAPEGTVGLYADKSLSLVSPIAASCTAGVAASLNGGLIASVNSTVAASLNAVAVSMNGAYSATVSATNASVVGDSSANLSSRAGTAYVEGPTVQLGRTEGALTPGYAYRGGMTGGQKATQRVDVRTEETFSVEAGSVDPVKGAPTSIVANTTMIRHERGDSTLTLDGNVTARSGQTGLLLAKDKLRLFVSQIPLEVPTDLILKIPEAANRAKKAAAETMEDLADSKNWLALAGGIVGTAAVMKTAMDISGKQGATGAERGLASALPVVTGALTGLTTLGVITLVEQKLAAAAKALGEEISAAATKVAHQSAKKALETEFMAQSKLPTNPSIEVTDEDITLSAGGSKITIGAKGIEIKAMLGMPVTINGQKITGLMPGSVEVD